MCSTSTRGSRNTPLSRRTHTSQSETLVTTPVEPAALAREFGISRETVYQYLARRYPVTESVGSMID
jgi:Helix-turn-helix domain of resolvase